MRDERLLDEIVRERVSPLFDACPPLPPRKSRGHFF